MRLALVELIQVGFFERDPSVSLINFNTKIILDALYGQILAQRPELVINVLVVCTLPSPLGLEHLEGLHENSFRAHLAWIGGLSQAEVRLLNSHACALNAGMLCILIQAHFTVIESLSDASSVGRVARHPRHQHRLRLLVLLLEGVIELLQSLQTFEHIQILSCRILLLIKAAEILLRVAEVMKVMGSGGLVVSAVTSRHSTLVIG